MTYTEETSVTLGHLSIDNDTEAAFWCILDNRSGGESCEEAVCLGKYCRDRGGTVGNDGKCNSKCFQYLVWTIQVGCDRSVQD